MKDVELIVKPYKETSVSTLSKLYIGDEFICYILEDGYNEPKIPAETRIPSGRYEITRRTWGKHFERYKKRFNHISSLWIREVPNFKYILIHIGTNILHTAGCLLTGSRYSLSDNEYRIYESTTTYRKLYSRISEHFKQGERVFITIERKDPNK